MDIAALATEIARTLEAYTNGNYSYRPQFTTEADWAETLSVRFAELAQQLEAQSHAAETMRSESEALFEQTKESIAEAKVLHLAARSLETFDNLPKMLEKIVDNVATALPADTVMLVTVADDEIRHVVAGGSGGISTDISLEDFRAGLSGWALREMKPVLSPKNKPEPRESVKVHQRRADNNIGAVAVVPVHIGDQALGTLTALNKLDQRDFSERDIKLMSAMANHVATAIANAQLYQQSRQELHQRKKIEKALLKERDLLQALMESVPDYIYFKDARAHYVRCNVALATDLLGMASPQDVIGKTDFDFFPEPVAQARYDADREILSSGTSVMAQEVEISTPDGKTRWLSEHKIPRRNSAGKIIGLVGIARDITPLKEAASGLMHRSSDLNALPLPEQLRIFADVAEKSANTIVITDTNGIIQYANAKFAETTGYTVAEALGQHTRILKSGEMPQEKYAELWKTISSGRTWQGEFHNKRKDGSLYWEMAYISPIMNDAGEITHYLAVKEEITRRKVAEMNLARRETEVTALETLVHVSSEISRVLDTGELLQRAVDLTKEAFSLYHAHVYVREGQLLKLVAGAGKVGRQMVAEGWHIPADNLLSVVARVARSAEPIVLNKVHRGTDFLQNPLLPRTRAELAVPLVIGDDVLGVLDVQADTADFFSEDDVRIYATLGAQVAVALQNTRLYTQIESALVETDTLYNVSRALNTIADLPQLLQTVTEMVAEALSATWTSVITVDMLAGRIEQKVAYGENADDILPDTFDDLMAGLGGWSLSQAQPVLSPKGAPDSRENLEQQQRRLRMGIGAVAVVPLRYHNKSLGVLSAVNALHARDFSEQDINLLTAIGNQVAAAIENRNLLEHSQKRAQQEQSLREVTEKLRAAPNLDLLLQTAAEELGKRLGARHTVLELGVDHPTDKTPADGETYD